MMYFECKHVSYAYGNVRATHNVSFSGGKGEIIGLIGENGAGKSTLIKNILRYLRPDSGTITLEGVDVFKMRNAQFPVAYIPDVPVFYDELSLLEHLHFIKAIFPDSPTTIEAMRTHFELDAHVHKIPAALSKGTRQKLMIAMALLREYDMLIADEPFTGLDPKQISVLKHTFWRQRQQGKLVLLSTHLLDLVGDICDTYVVMQRGRVIATGSKAELLAKAGLTVERSLEGIYLKLVET